MTADNDILERLPRWKTGPVLREHPGYFLVPERDIDEAAAEIVRLRGEVESLRGQIHDEIAANLAFREAGGALPDEDMPTFCARLISERNAVRQIIENWRHDAEIEAAISRLDRNALRACADELDAALQHRGDSREVGRG